MTEQIPNRLSRTESSTYLLLQHGIRRKASTLAKLASVGGGPAFRKIGARHVAYDKSELDRWAEALLSREMRSTSEAV